MNILALDMATTSGFAALKGDHLFSGAWKNPESHARAPGRFFHAFRLWLCDLQRWYEPQIVAWEFTPPARGIAATMIHIGMVTRVQEFAWRHEIETATIHPSTLKKFTTGNGRAEKSEMIAAMRKRWNWRGTDDNEADALAVLSYALDYEQGRESRT